MPTSRVPAANQSLRVLHGMIAASLLILVVLFVVFVQVRGGPLLRDPGTAVVDALITGIALVLVVAAVLLRLRVREIGPGSGPAPHQSAGRTGAVLLWGLLDAAGTLAAVGYLLTGAVAPAMAAALALLALLWNHPGRLAGE